MKTDSASLAYAAAADSSVHPATRQYSVTCHVMRLMEKRIAGYAHEPHTFSFFLNLIVY